MKDRGNDATLSVDFKLYIQDKNSAWVDFSDSGNRYGVDALKALGTIKNKIDADLGSLVTTVQSVTLRNEGGFFDKPFPSSLKTTTGTSSSFDHSKNYKRPILRGRKCKIAARCRVPNTYLNSAVIAWAPIDVTEEIVLGYFIVNEITPDIQNNEISLDLISLDGKLQKKDGSGITDGKTWYENRPISFLIEKILESEFGSVAVTDNITREVFRETLDDSFVTCNLGRPPLWDGTTWRRDELYTRALCVADVASIGNRLYLGCDEQLWSFNLTTGVYTKIGEVTADYYIRKIWYDSTLDQLILLTCKDEYWPAKATAWLMTGWDMKVYSWDGTTLAEETSGSNYMTTMRYFMRVPVGDTGWTPPMWFGWGFIDPVSDFQLAEGSKVPFSQDVRSIDIDSSGVYPYYAEDGEDVYDDTTPPVVVESTDFLSSNDRSFFSNENSMVHLRSEGTVDYGAPSLVWNGAEICSMIHTTAKSGKRICYWFEMNTIADTGIDSGSSQTVNLCSSKHAYSAIGSSATWYKLNGLLLDGSNTKGQRVLPDGLHKMQPTCMCINGTSDTGLVFFQEWNDGQDESDGITRVYLTTITLTNVTPASWSTTSPFGATIYDITNSETGDNRYWSVINARCFDNNSANLTGTDDRFVLVWFNRKTGYYAITIGTAAELIGHTAYSSSTLLKSSKFPVLALEVDTVDHTILAYVAGESRIYQINRDETITPLNSHPVSTSEFGLLSNLACNNSHAAGEPDVFGVSSPMSHLETFSTYQSGKYNLFRGSKYLSDIVSLADFTDKNKWDLLKMLSQATDGVCFFDRDGNFNYVPRLYSASTANYSIGGFDSDVKVINSAKLSYGYDRLYNSVKVSIYDTFYDPPKADCLSLVLRPTKSVDATDLNDVPFVDYSIEQRGTDKQIVYAYCVKAGSTTNGTSRWKYRLSESEIEATIDGAHASSATTLTLKSVFGGDGFEGGIHSGDFITHNDPDSNDELTRKVVSVDEVNNQIVIYSAFGVALQDKVVLKVSLGFTSSSGNTKNYWSDEGVCYTTGSSSGATIAVNSVKDVSVGTIVKFGESDGQEYRILSIATLTLTVDRTISPAVSADAVVISFYSPSSADGSEVGGSGVYIKWTTGDGTEGTDYNKTFCIGDRFVIDCPGSRLEEDASGLQIVMDGSSIATHDKNELTIDNRFLDRNTGLDIAKRIVSNRAQPKFWLDITIPLTPYIDIVTNKTLTQISVVSAKLFPTSQNFTETFTINEISHNPKQLTTTLVLEGITPF
jgi:hypothetical protein